jgi:hypothetical protein
LLFPALSGAALSLAFACGGISDPTRGGTTQHVATVSGALTGTSVPPGAHVALVWRKGPSGGLAVGADVPVVNNRFSMGLDVPPDDYFGDMNANSSVILPPSGSAGSASGGSSGATPGNLGANSLGLDDTASGQITGPLQGAVGGFIVYVDTDGNGQLDFANDRNATSSDQLIGGDKDIILTYLRGGAQLDYEKLRDRAGVLPAEGFNLALEDGRWVPLYEVDLKIAPEQLPTPVCDGGGFTGVSGGNVDVPTPTTTGNAGTTSPTPGGSGPGPLYPSPGEPGLRCAPDCRSFTYAPPCPPAPPPPPPGLCTSYDILVGDCAGGWGGSLASGAPVPKGWPCPCPVGTTDAGVGSFDGGGPTDAGVEIPDSPRGD